MSICTSSGRYAADVRRAALPEVLFVPDLALALGRTERSVRRLLVGGRVGIPYLRLGRRLAVRREALLAALADRETRPLGAS
jgi:hypothetical protein